MQLLYELIPRGSNSCAGFFEKHCAKKSPLASSGGGTASAVTEGFNPRRHGRIVRAAKGCLSAFLHGGLLEVTTPRTDAVRLSAHPKGVCSRLGAAGYWEIQPRAIRTVRNFTIPPVGYADSRLRRRSLLSAQQTFARTAGNNPLRKGAFGALLISNSKSVPKALLTSYLFTLTSYLKKRPAGALLQRVSNSLCNNSRGVNFLNNVRSAVRGQTVLGGAYQNLTRGRA